VAVNTNCRSDWRVLLKDRTPLGNANARLLQNAWRFM
jgi:hypothetical protein